MTSKIETFVGIDISKATLEIAIHGQPEVSQQSNDEAGIATVVQALQELDPTLIVVEASGGWEIGLVPL